MSNEERPDSPDESTIGLCVNCLHLRSQQTRRGAVFYRCARADDDDRFMRYPPVPVRRCLGFETDVEKDRGAEAPEAPEA
jgi:hypothetical protein